MKLIKSKIIIYFIGLLSLLGFMACSFLLSFVLNGFSTKGNWWNWQTILVPFIIWIIFFGFYLLYLKYFNKPTLKKNLASAEWMNENSFTKRFPVIKENAQFESNWLVKTHLTRKKELIFNQTNLLGHALVIGSTGSGKTALLLNSTIQTFAKSSNKPSMIFADPKGELFNTHSQMIAHQGYEVLSLNLRDYEKSSFWNPLSKIWKLWFSKDKVEFKREQALNYLSELTSAIFPPSKAQDSFFDDAAFSVFQFFVILMLEKANNDSSIKEKHFNIFNIVSNINQTNFDALQNELANLDHNSLALSIGGIHIQGAEKTVTNILQTVVTKLKVYLDPVIKRITCQTTLKIDVNKPQAIFLIVPDESEAKYPFISLFIAEIYKELISLASINEESKLSRRFYFLLDEFGNVPKISSMAAMITVARSRNIFFMLLIQNYAQLNAKYGNEVANTIISNCAFEYFLLTSDVETANKFSQKLGKKSLISSSKSISISQKGTSSSSSNESEQTRQLIHPDELMRLQFGKFILSMQREKPIKSSLAPLWNWKHFSKGKIDQEKHIINDFQNQFNKSFITSLNSENNQFISFDQFQEQKNN